MLLDSLRNRSDKEEISEDSWGTFWFDAPEWLNANSDAYARLKFFIVNETRNFDLLLGQVLRGDYEFGTSVGLAFTFKWSVRKVVPSKYHVDIEWVDTPSERLAAETYEKLVPVIISERKRLAS